ncbi:hypothetical protein L6R52_28380 [Myxococcota bacterium]|nr:hypothetical protein [Myxococcota bacterium]
MNSRRFEKIDLLTLIAAAFVPLSAACTQDTLLLEATTARIDAAGGSLKSADGRLTLTFPAGSAATVASVSIQVRRSDLPAWAESPFYAIDTGGVVFQGATLTLLAGDEICPAGLTVASVDTPYPVGIDASSYDPALGTVTAPFVGAGTFTLVLDRDRLAGCVPSDGPDAGPPGRAEPFAAPPAGTCPTPLPIIGYADAGPNEPPTYAGVLQIAESGPTSVEEPQLLCTEAYYMTIVDGFHESGDYDYYLFEVTRTPAGFGVGEFTYGPTAHGLLSFVLYDASLRELGRSRDGTYVTLGHRIDTAGVYVLRVGRGLRGNRMDYRFVMTFNDIYPDGGYVSYADWARAHDASLPEVPDRDAGLPD